MNASVVNSVDHVLHLVALQQQFASALSEIRVNSTMARKLSNCGKQLNMVDEMPTKVDSKYMYVYHA